MKKNTGRGPVISELAVRMLWTESGGRCQFAGCNEDITRDELTLYRLNAGNNAHIVASSSNGPRGGDKSLALSNDIDNIMLLCPKHHKLVDSNTGIYTTEKLKMMREEHNKKVAFLLNTMNYPKTKILLFKSPIKGTKKVHIDYNQAVEAVRETRMNPLDSTGVTIEIENHEDYKSPMYWERAEKDLVFNVNQYIEPLYERFPDTILSVFPIAPIPLIIKLGFILGDKRRTNIYQKTRTPDTWEWRGKEASNTFETQKIVRDSRLSKVALVISLTAEIDMQRVLSVYDADIIYCINARRKDVDCITSEEDLKLFWHEYQAVCERLKNEDRCTEVAVFPSVPVSAAFEMGRRYMIGVYPKMVIYDDDEGFVKTIEIGGGKNDE